MISDGLSSLFSHKKLKNHVKKIFKKYKFLLFTFLTIMTGDYCERQAQRHPSLCYLNYISLQKILIINELNSIEYLHQFNGCYYLRKNRYLVIIYSSLCLLFILVISRNRSAKVVVINLTCYLCFVKCYRCFPAFLLLIVFVFVSFFKVVLNF